MCKKNFTRMMFIFLLCVLWWNVIPCNAAEIPLLDTVSGNIVVDMEMNGDDVSKEVFPAELDMGDYQSQMVIGEKQLLMITVLPEDTTNKQLTYESNNTQVATVNGMGRVTAVGIGEAVITVSCGAVKSELRINIISDPTQIPVRDIEISSYEETLEVDSTMRLLTTVLPNDATNATVTYSSSDANIATVNSSGEIKGIASGDVVIYVSAGGVQKQIPLKVKVGTTAIELNGDYHILKPEETFQIEAVVKPKNAQGKLSYKSLDEEVAVVSANGLITAKSSGSTAVIVTNGELYVSVSVIVNENEAEKVEGAPDYQKNEMEKMVFPDMVDVTQYPIISSEMLEHLYINKSVLTIRGENYTIYLDGKNIVNLENELDTRIIFTSQENGVVFSVNNGKKLCGKITVDLNSVLKGANYLYLYNNAKECYEKIAADSLGTLTIDTEGEYLLAFDEIGNFEWNYALLGGGMIMVIIGAVIFVGVKRQYWFW